MSARRQQRAVVVQETQAALARPRNRELTSALFPLYRSHSRNGSAQGELVVCYSYVLLLMYSFLPSTHRSLAAADHRALQIASDFNAFAQQGWVSSSFILTRTYPPLYL